MAVQNKKKKDKGARSEEKKPRVVLMAAVLIGAVLLVVASSGIFNKKDPVSESPAHTSPDQRQLKDLVGRWARTDGGYVIEIRTIGADGKMDAGYYNPRPVNVSTAEAFVTSNGAKVFLQLHDVGYPGSTYLLNHDSETDKLVGIYFQAALQQHFDVVFARLD